MSNYLKKLATIKAEKEQGESGCCWRCGARSEAPDLDEQIEDLARIHAMHPPIYALTASELTNLRRLLEPGDLIAVIANFHRMVSATYSSIAIIRNGKFMQIDRRTLGS